MKTASFKTYTGPGRVSIARWHPRNTPPGFKVCKALAPGEWFNKVRTAEYLKRYDTQLQKLSAAGVYAELVTLAGVHEPVLLCWEHPEDDDFCHRALVAQWFQKTLGIRVPELGYERRRVHPLAP